MVMQIGADVETNLVLTFTYDDGSVKTKLFSVGDYISVDFNKDGLRRTVSGTVNAIHADPYNGRLSRKDWYIVLVNGDKTKEDCGFVGALKIRVLEMIDLTVLSKGRQVTAVNSPNDEYNITDIRLFGDKFQVSQNEGMSWLTIGEVAKDDSSEDGSETSGDSKDSELISKIYDLIATDRNSVKDQVIAALFKLMQDGKVEPPRKPEESKHHQRKDPDALIDKLNFLIDKLEPKEQTSSEDTKKAEIDNLISKLTELIEKANTTTPITDPDPETPGENDSNEPTDPEPGSDDDLGGDDEPNTPSDPNPTDPGNGNSTGDDDIPDVGDD